MEVKYAGAIPDQAKRGLYLRKLDKTAIRPSTTMELHRTGQFIGREEIRAFAAGEKLFPDQELYYWTGSLEGKKWFIARICSCIGRPDKIPEDLEKGECNMRIYFVDEEDRESEDYMMWLIVYTMIVRHIFLMLKDHTVLIWILESDLVCFDVLSFMGFQQAESDRYGYVSMRLNLERNAT